MKWLVLFLFTTVLALLPPKDTKNSVFVFSDISNEPDDAESIVRLLLYSNELDIKGIVATTSFWLNYTCHDEDIYPIIDAYEKVRPNLLKHSPDYPTADYLRSVVSRGQDVYGMEAINHPLSEGAKLFIDAVDNTLPGDDLYVLIWGGSNPVAEALHHVMTTRTKQELDIFTAKIFFYQISDQDNSGPWIRQTFPMIRLVTSLTGYNQYGHAAWTGMTGDRYYNYDKGGPNPDIVSNQWVDETIRPFGPLGDAYPNYLFAMEGDTPSVLYMIPNGLNDPEHPEYGGWGGRYIRNDLSAVYNNWYTDCQDSVIGQDGKKHTSNHATIWRWRDAFQNDFANRIQWTIKDFDETAHAPVIVANDTQSVKTWYVPATAGSNLTIDLSKSFDLNDRPFTFTWFHYREISLTQGNPQEVQAIPITPLNEQESIVTIPVPNFATACLNAHFKPAPCRRYHFIAEAQNDAGMRSYKRVVVEVVPGPNDAHDEDDGRTMQQNLELIPESFLFPHDEL